MSVAIYQSSLQHATATAPPLDLPVGTGAGAGTEIEVDKDKDMRRVPVTHFLTVATAESEGLARLRWTAELAGVQVPSAVVFRYLLTYLPTYLLVMTSVCVINYYDNVCLLAGLFVCTRYAQVKVLGMGEVYEHGATKVQTIG